MSSISRQLMCTEKYMTVLYIIITRYEYNSGWLCWYVRERVMGRCDGNGVMVTGRMVKPPIDGMWHQMTPILRTRHAGRMPTNAHHHRDLRDPLRTYHPLRYNYNTHTDQYTWSVSLYHLECTYVWVHGYGIHFNGATIRCGREYRAWSIKFNIVHCYTNIRRHNLTQFCNRA